MDALALARLQFALTTVYHFFFVPLTLGLSIVVAVMETMYVRTGNETYKHMTKFWGGSRRLAAAPRLRSGCRKTASGMRATGCAPPSRSPIVRPRR